VQKIQKLQLTTPYTRVHHVCTKFPVQYLSLSKELTALEESTMSKLIRSLWSDDAGQDIAEYAVMLAVILVLVVGTVRLIGSNANNAFSSVASSLQ
jgi:Flp pilus assembly pilin Flp